MEDKKRTAESYPFGANKELAKQAGAVGGKKSTYKRTRAQKKAASERMKKLWEARRGEKRN